jgi:DNA polymerase-3 subunit epsilon
MSDFDWIIPDFLGGKRFVVFDLETTGLDPKKDRIVEIGAVKFDQHGLNARFSVLINPGISMPFAASQVNHITDEMLKDKASLEDVLPDFIRFIDDTILIAHNSNFDCSFINEALSKMFQQEKKLDETENGLGLFNSDALSHQEQFWSPPFSSMPNKVIDTIPLAKQIFPGRWKYNLQDLSRDLGIQSKDAHRAEDDARVCMEIFLKCIEQMQQNAV